jgi:hypothetical protein
MSDKIKTKAELIEMLAEAVRNTQPAPVRNTKPEPVHDAANRAEAQNATPQNATSVEARGQN